MMRRDLITAASAFGIAPVAALSLPVSSAVALDPHQGWLDEWRDTLSAWCTAWRDADETETAVTERLWARMEELGRLIAGTRPHTIGGAAAQIHWVLEDGSDYLGSRGYGRALVAAVQMLDGEIAQ